MEGNLTTIIGLLGASFTLFNAVMKLRQEIDDRRDFALGVDKDGRGIHKEVRLYILRKDVMERCIAVVLLMASVGLSSTGAAAYIWACNKNVDAFLTGILGFFGLSCLGGSVCTLVLGYRGYKKWKDYIISGQWYGKQIDIASGPEEHSEPDGA